MSVRWRWPGAGDRSGRHWRISRRRLSPTATAGVAALALACAPTPAARAQTLNIGPAEVPASAGSAAQLAREELADDLDWLSRELEQGFSRQTEAQIALRRYALSMLPQPEAPGPDPVASVQLVGRTLWRLAPEIDAAITSAGDEAAGHIVLLLSRAPAPLEAAEAELALRDALAPLAAQPAQHPPDGAPLGGWIDALPAARPGADLARPLDDEASRELASAGADDATLEQIHALESLLHEADQWRAYRRSAAAVRSLLRRAAAALQVDRAWVDEITAAALADAWADAARRLADDREDAALQLELLAGIISALELLDVADALEGQQWDRTRAAAQAAIAHDPTMRSPQFRASARMLARVAVLAGSGARGPTERSPTERSVVRQVRPAWRALTRARDQAEEDLSAVAPDLLTAGRAVTDPGALAALAAMEQAAADMYGLILISAVIADPQTPDGREPRVAAEHRLTAARLLRHGQALQSGENADSALRELRQFAALLRARDSAPSVTWLPGQPEDIQQAWRTIAGGRAMELLQTDADLMGTWLHIWGDTNDATRLRDLQQRLRAHELLLPLLRDMAEAAAVASNGRVSGEVDELRQPAPGRAAPWPGWELSIAAMDATLARADARLADAVTLALDRRGPAPANRAAALSDDLAPLRLLARLERALAAAEAPAGWPLDEIALGPPLPGSLLAEGREALATASLALEDWAMAPEADGELWPRAVTASARALRETGP